MELGAQPPGLAGGTAQPPLSALGAAGGPRQRERSLRGTLLLGGGELLAVPVGGELGELVHGGSSPLPAVAACRVLHCHRPERAVTIRSAHRTGTGLGWAGCRMGAGTGWGWRQAAGGGKGPVTGQAELRFGGLLRRLRDDAGLTQDELAEAAQVSQRAISDLERGINATARTDTARLLAGALGLDGPARELFMRPRGAARRRVRRWQPR